MTRARNTHTRPSPTQPTHPSTHNHRSTTCATTSTCRVAPMNACTRWRSPAAPRPWIRPRRCPRTRPPGCWSRSPRKRWRWLDEEGSSEREGERSRWGGGGGAGGEDLLFFFFRFFKTTIRLFSPNLYHQSQRVCARAVKGWWTWFVGWVRTGGGSVKVFCWEEKRTRDIHNRLLVTLSASRAATPPHFCCRPLLLRLVHVRKQHAHNKLNAFHTRTKRKATLRKKKRSLLSPLSRPPAPLYLHLASHWSGRAPKPTHNKLFTPPTPPPQTGSQWPPPQSTLPAPQTRPTAPRPPAARR